MILKEEVKKIAKLARLGISEQEAEKYQKDLSAILDYMEKLNSVSTEGIDATFLVTGQFDQYRADEKKEKTMIEKKETREKILNNAPDKKEGSIKVKQIFQ